MDTTKSNIRKINLGPSTKDGETHNGRTWRDMPGQSREDMLMNWYSYKRGKLTDEYIRTRGKCAFRC